MKNVFFASGSLALMLLCAATALPPSIAANEVLPLKQSETACDDSLTHLSRQITTDGRRISTSLEAREISGAWNRGRPADRPYQVRAIMSGDAEDISAVLSSPQMLTGLAHAVIRDCNLVSVVTYAMDRTDNIHDYGLVGETVKFFECVEGYDRATPAPNWGFQYCY
jgi:hypothetical protein